jgi:hypothetical protein
MFCSAPAASLASGDNGGYRLVHRPIVAFQPRATKPEYIVYVRLNREVPRLSNGSPLAGVHVDGYGLDLPPTPGSESGWGLATAGNRARSCYTTSFINVLKPLPSSLRRPRVGRLVHVAVFISGVPRAITATARVERFQAGGTSPRTNPYQRRLGCVHT